MTVTQYPADVRWLDYQTQREPTRKRRNFSPGTLRVIAISIGAAAAAWGLMHLTLRLLS